MPRLRPPKDDESIEIDITPEEQKPAEVEVKSRIAVPMADVRPEEPVEVEASKEPEEQEDDNSLKRQLEELRAAEASHKAQLAQETARRQQAEQIAEEHRQRADQSRGDVEQAQYDWVLSTMAAAQAESAAAENDYAAALHAADYRGAAESQKRLSRAEARLMQLEDAKTNFETARQQRVNNPPQQQPIQTQDPIDQLNQLSGREKDWLRQHRDAITDPDKLPRLQVAYMDAMKEGVQRDSPEYFEFLERRLGYRTGSEAKKKDERSFDDPDQGRDVSHQMPVTRESPNSSGRSSPNRITLSPQQREAARISGLTDKEYATQVLKLQKEKVDGKYREDRYG